MNKKKDLMNMEKPDSNEIIKDMEMDKLRDKDIVVAEKICNHRNRSFYLKNEDVWGDGWIKDATCPHCKNTVHVWIDFFNFSQPSKE